MESSEEQDGETSTITLFKSRTMGPSFRLVIEERRTKDRKIGGQIMRTSLY